MQKLEQNLPCRNLRAAGARARAWQAVLLALLLVASASAPDAYAAGPALKWIADQHHATPDLDSLPADKYGDLVRLGHRLFTDTPKYAPRFANNALSCGNCHLDEGRQPFAAPMWAAWGMYPAYLTKTDRVNTFSERIQQCFKFSLNGFAPPLDSQEIRALLAYAQWLARGVPAGVEMRGRGFLTLRRTGSDPNPQRGRGLYAEKCAACHGVHGDGVQAEGKSLPPLWGMRSYNKGAGMHRIELLAGFIKANMPFGNPNLTNQEAWDIAAWIQLQERWPDPRQSLIKGFLEK